MRTGRLVLRLALVLALLAVLLPGGVLLVLASERGTAWLLHQAVALARPQGVQIEIGQVEGTLLDRLVLSDVRLRGGGARIEAGRLLLQWAPVRLVDRVLHIRALEIADLRVTPPPAGAAEQAPPQIPQISLPIAVRLDRLLAERVSVEQPEGALSLDRLVLGARLDAQGVSLTGLQAAAPGIALQGDLRMQAAIPHAIEGGLRVRIDRSLTGEQVGTVGVHADLSGAALQPVIDLRLSEPAPLRLNARLELDRLQPAFAVRAQWPRLGWPLRGEAEYSATDGRLELHGTADDYRIALSAGLVAQGLPGGQLDLAATGDPDGLRLQPLRVAALDGELLAEGRLGWRDGLRWDLALSLEDLNPGRYLADWPGLLRGRLSVSGRVGAGDDAALSLDAQVHELSGELRGYPVGAQGAVAVRGSTLEARALQLASGDNRVGVDGQLGEHLRLTFVIDAPDLASLYPGLTGRLQGEGRLAGTVATPQLVAKLDGEGVGFGETGAQALQLELDWQEAGGSGRARVAGLAAPGIGFDEIVAELGGTPSDHRLDLAATGPLLDATLQASGGVERQSWRGRLHQLGLSRSDLGAWQLGNPVDLQLAADAARAGRLCLVQGDTRLCAAGGWSAATGIDLEGSLAALDLRRLGPYLPGDAQIEGGLAGDFRVKGQPQRLSASLALRPSDGLVLLENEDGPLQIAYRNALLEARFEDDRGSADLSLDVGTNGVARGRVKLGPEREGQRALGGGLSVDFPDLGLVAGFVPALREVKGRLHLGADLAGTLQAPRFLGTLEVLDASAEVVAAGVVVSDIGLSVRGDGTGPMRVQGQARSGEGQVALSGTVDPGGRDGPALDLAIRGARFQAVRLPEATVEVSPDLRLTGTGPYHLSGTLLIPTARVEIKELPKGSVAVSDDQIVFDGDEKQARDAAPQNLTARVRVELGDAVTFKGFGLTTGLSGNLDATVDQRGTGVDGKIELVDGRYKAYGQDLQIERGRLLFAGPPGNPDVDLRALRVSRDGRVKAYLAMTGGLTKPRPRVYSEPALPDAEALAYLLTGRGLDQAGRQEGLDIAGAALSLGLAKGEPLLQDLSDRLGLDELRVESGENGLEESSLIVGKYLNPDLYLGYSQNLFQPEGAVLLRLRLTEQVEVETRSGNSQSVDLYYRLEHD